MSYSKGSHTVYHHRYHIVWITKYRYKVLEGALRERIRVIIRQVCDELGVQIVSGVLSKVRLDPDDMAEQVRLYYRQRGWGDETDQQAENGDDDEKFKQGEAVIVTALAFAHG